MEQKKINFGKFLGLIIAVILGIFGISSSPLTFLEGKVMGILFLGLPGAYIFIKVFFQPNYIGGNIIIPTVRRSFMLILFGTSGVTLSEALYYIFDILNFSRIGWHNAFARTVFVIGVFLCFTSFSGFIMLLREHFAPQNILRENPEEQKKRKRKRLFVQAYVFLLLSLTILIISNIKHDVLLERGYEGPLVFIFYFSFFLFIKFLIGARHLGK